MQIYRIKKTVSKDGTLTIKRLPFQPGAKVEVTVRNAGRGAKRSNPYPLRGTPIRFLDPFGSVAVGDWEALK